MRKGLALDKFKMENMTIVDNHRAAVGVSLSRSLSTIVFSGAENAVKESRRCRMWLARALLCASCCDDLPWLLQAPQHLPCDDGFSCQRWQVQHVVEMSVVDARCAFRLMLRLRD